MISVRLKETDSCPLRRAFPKSSVFPSHSSLFSEVMEAPEEEEEKQTPKREEEAVTSVNRAILTRKNCSEEAGGILNS